MVRIDDYERDRVHQWSQLGCILGVGGGALAFLFTAGIADLFDGDLVVLLGALTIGGFVGGWLRCFGITAGFVSVSLIVYCTNSPPDDPSTVAPWPIVIGLLGQLGAWIWLRLAGSKAKRQGNAIQILTKKRRFHGWLPIAQMLRSFSVPLLAWIAVVMLASAFARVLQSPILGGTLVLAAILSGVVLFLIHISTHIHR